MRILIAAASAPAVQALADALRQRGHALTIVTDSEAAVDNCNQGQFDLMLLEVGLPVMGGIEATRRIRATGGRRWVPILLLAERTSNEEIVAGLDAGADDYLVKPLDIDVFTAHKRSMQRISTMQQTLFGILDNVFEGVLTIDSRGVVQSFNRAAEKIFGYEQPEVVGRNVSMLMPSPFREEHDDYIARYLAEGTPRVIGIGRKVFGRRKDGDVFPMKLAVTEVDDRGQKIFVGLVRDISIEESSRERVEFLALHDSLTGLPNRSYFMDTLDVVMKCEEPGVLHAVLLIDLDGFKPINDTLGHAAGDAALKTVAIRLRHNLAANDFAARLGGDEFVAIARDVTSREAAARVGDRLIAAISEPMDLDGRLATLGASIGIALVPQHGDTAKAIYIAADSAMYHAKQAGKGRVMFAGTAPDGAA